jgi:hypothetical protein
MNDEKLNFWQKIILLMTYLTIGSVFLAAFNGWIDLTLLDVRGDCGER